MILINIILLLKILGLGFLISNFEPIQWIIDYLPDNMIKWNLMLLFGCLKCVSFWISLIWMGNIWFSIFVFFVGKAISNDDLYKYYTGRIKDSIKLWIHKKRMNYYHKQMEKIIKKIEKENGVKVD